MWELVLVIIAVLITMEVVSGQTFTQQKNPIIAEVVPWFGGMEGGTEISIYGANFASDFLFTDSIVYIGNEQCDIINYKSNAQKLVCMTPKCYDPLCLEGSTHVAMTLSVYVATIEGVLFDTDDFQYYDYYTNRMNALQQTSYAFATTWLNAYTRNVYLSDFSLMFDGRYRGDFGSNGELNLDEQYYYDNEKILFYHPPADMPAGYINISLYSQNDQSDGVVSTGVANMYPHDKYSNTWYRYYLFQSTLSGEVYSFNLLPAISSVVPRTGSLSGGTRVVITGSGFTDVKSELTVYVSGVLCDVETSTVDEIICITRNAQPNSAYTLLNLTKTDDDLEYDVQLAAADTINGGQVTNLQFPFQLPSARDQGSPGWWIKIWNYQDHTEGTMGEHNTAKLSFGFHQAFYFSMYEGAGQPGHYWPTYIDGLANNHHYYGQDAATIFNAAYSKCSYISVYIYIQR